jgi:hypothetical protein
MCIHKPFVIAVVGSADGQTFLAQSPYVFYEGEKCKVVGTIHNSNDETNDLCVYPLEYRRAVCWFPLRLSIDKPIEISLLIFAVVDSADVSWCALDGRRDSTSLFLAALWLVRSSHFVCLLSLLVVLLVVLLLLLLVLW